MTMKKKKVTGYTMISIWSETQLLVQQNIHLLLLRCWISFYISQYYQSVFLGSAQKASAFCTYFLILKIASAEVCSKSSVFSTDFTSNGAPQMAIIYLLLKQIGQSVKTQKSQKRHFGPLSGRNTYSGHYMIFEHNLYYTF
ncbi:Hypothetical_protein [Hexamita inflata]|uniref:Hypothetical_protein n=1 Tax=Hexamita inflata TaxID=28002 RepID=A0AA86N630_9EUKA|nr:Hypothetical protein HINF_LOCUS1115 [Hexamita inflata]